MHYGWSAPVLPILRSENTPVPITRNDETWLESAYLLAGLAAIPVTAYLVDKIGRKKSIMTASCIALTSWIIIAFATTVNWLYLARVLSGMSEDMANIATPMYISEIADQNIRGFLVGFNFFMMIFGILLIYSIAPFTPYYAPSLIGGTLIILQFALSFFIPTSPYFLLNNNKKREAKKSLRRLRSGKDENDELENIIKAIERQKIERGKVQDLVLIKSNRKGVMIITVLCVCQHFSGFSVIVMNVHTILSSTGSVYLKSEYTGIASAALMLLGAAVGIFCVDKFGRKTLLVISSVLTMFCLVNMINVSWIPVVSILTFNFTFKLGLAFVPQILASELFSSQIKAVGMAFGDTMFIIFSSLSVIFYQYFSQYYGIYVPLYAFAAVSFSTAIFTIFVVPETKGKTLEEIQLMLKGEIFRMPNDST
ncbi:Sugar tr and/or MFS 1 domain containing protein [Asbolus verrucosus]|uniref:Sugar tr and/or MFS 1 domain containing protein n=1 Tax=Asbolus verrucosus TaxID=1661398 RepID=A0A482W637_ASBVE|nr:Sugar tr and/or MFS 1 domain containing protein [Asbolus verrucosus]